MEKLAIQLLETDQASHQAAQHILDTFDKEKILSKKTLLFLSGGSCIDVVSVLLSIIPKNVSLSNLTVCLADERWLKPGSPDSNEQQLKEKDLLNELQTRGARFISMLAVSSDPEEAARMLSSLIQQEISESEEVILLAGVGADGHTLGILPHQDASLFFQNFSHQQLVKYYETTAEQNNPHKKRITLTFTAVAKMTRIFIYAVGEAKKDALQHFVNKDTTVNQVPALGLYLSEAVPQLYTDQSL